MGSWNPFRVPEDFGPVVFRIVRHAPRDISEFIPHDAGTLEFRLEHEANELTPVAWELAEFCGEIVDHGPRFGEGTEAYGDVRTRFEALRKAFLGLCQEAENR